MENLFVLRDDQSVFDEPWLRQIVGDADMPARKIGTSRFYMTGHVPSVKGIASQSAESSLEQDFLTLLEYDPRVERYVAQPFTIEWKDKLGKKRRYTPDVIVKYSYHALLHEPWLKTTIFEVKPREILTEDWAELRPKFRNAMGWAKEYGCVFHLITDKEIRTPYLDNVRFLKRYKNLTIETSLYAARQQLVYETMRGLQQTTPKDLLNAMVKDEMLQAELIPWIWIAINMQRIGTDLNLPLNMNSTIWWNG